jgi:outer membrane lipoprotein carrier protein
MNMDLRVWLALIVSLVVAADHPLAQQQTAAELAASLQGKYATVRDFSADFVQTYRGRVMVRKPGKMRWEYKTPEEKLFVSDGARVYSYIPQDKLVQVAAVPPDDQASSPALFLAGKGDITRDFTPALVERPAGYPDGTRALKLVPRTPQAEYDWLIIVVDPATLTLRGLVTGDSQGGTSSFSFTNLKENVGLADKLFTFTPPRGVEIVEDSPRR